VRDGKQVTIRLPVRYRFLVLVVPIATAWFFVRILIGDFYYQSAMVLKEQLYLDAAVVSLQRAVAWQPANALYYRELGRVYMAMSPWRQDRARRIAEAISAYRRAVELNPYDSATLFDLAMAEVAQNQLGEAQDTILSALKVDPNNPALYEMLGAVYGSQGKLAQAKTALEHALALSPYDPQAIRNELRLIDRILTSPH
jgi:tetratricopeptide (TPR) repeat protein